MKLTPQEINSFARKLEKEKEDLLHRIQTLKQSEDFGDDTDHFEEEADETEEKANDASILASLKEELEDTKRALEKIKEGTFGICEQCGSVIEKKVLEVNPASHLCKHCKKMQK